LASEFHFRLAVAEVTHRYDLPDWLVSTGSRFPQAADHTSLLLHDAL
jgi:hypothetical protein